ncbi:MAG: hypothetical protein AB1630_13100, partial [bacterium]
MKIKIFLFLFIGLIISQRLYAKPTFNELFEYWHHETERHDTQQKAIERLCTRLEMGAPGDGATVEGTVVVSANAYGYYNGPYIPNQENTRFAVVPEGYIGKPTQYCYEFLGRIGDVFPNCNISALWDTTELPTGWYYIWVSELIMQGDPPYPVNCITSNRIKVYVNNKFMVRISPTKQYFYKGGITKSHKITIENKTNKEFT